MVTGVSEGARGTPSARLRPFVVSYSGYRLSGYEPGEHIGMPSPYLTVIIAIGPKLEIADSPRQGSCAFETLASGISAEPVTIAHDGNLTETTMTSKMTTNTRTTIWPTFKYKDAHAAIRYLVDVLGFVEKAVYGEGDRVDHAKLLWLTGGGVMLRSVRQGSALGGLPPGVGSVYIVTDEPDAIHDRVVFAGSNLTQGLRDEDYRSRGFTCRDPEGVHWSFGTYAGTQ